MRIKYFHIPIDWAMLICQNQFTVLLYPCGKRGWLTDHMLSAAGCSTPRVGDLLSRAQYSGFLNHCCNKISVLFKSCSIDRFRKFPELFKWFKDFLGYKESGGSVEAVPSGATGKERISGELAMEIGME